MRLSKASLKHRLKSRCLNTLGDKSELLLRLAEAKLEDDLAVDRSKLAAARQPPSRPFWGGWSRIRHNNQNLMLETVHRDEDAVPKKRDKTLEKQLPCALCEYPFWPDQLVGTVTLRAVWDLRKRWGLEGFQKRGLNLRYSSAMICTFCMQFFDLSACGDEPHTQDVSCSNSCCCGSCSSCLREIKLLAEAEVMVGDLKQSHDAFGKHYSKKTAEEERHHQLLFGSSAGHKVHSFHSLWSSLDRKGGARRSSTDTPAFRSAHRPSPARKVNTSRPGSAPVGRAPRPFASPRARRLMVPDRPVSAHPAHRPAGPPTSGSARGNPRDSSKRKVVKKVLKKLKKAYPRIQLSKDRRSSVKKKMKTLLKTFGLPTSDLSHFFVQKPKRRQPCKVMRPSEERPSPRQTRATRMYRRVHSAAPPATVVAEEPPTEERVEDHVSSGESTPSRKSSSSSSSDSD